MKFFLFALLVFLCAAANAEAITWHVAKAAQGGSNGNTCTQAQSVSTPKLTVDEGLACLVASGGPGDSLAIRSGTYAESIDTASRLIPNGTSFSNAVRIYAYDGTGTVIMQDPGAGGLAVRTGRQFIIFDGLIIDGSNIDNTNSLVFFQGNNLRAINVTARNTGLNFPSTTPGAGFQNAGNNNEYISCQMINNGSHSNTVGTSAPYGMYMGGTGNVVDGCTVSGNGGFGIHMYSTSGGVNNNTVKNSRIFHNGYGTEGAAHLGAGLLMAAGTGNIAYNNVVYDNNIGIQLSTTPQCVSCFIYGNTVYGNKLGIVANVTPTIRNNIFSNNTPDGNMLMEGSTTNISHNLCSGTCAYGTNNQTESASTTFITPGSDFHIKTGSVAIDTGTNLGSTYSPDLAGVARPTSGNWEIGAYEFSATPTCPAVSPALVASYSFEGNGNDTTGNGHTASLGSGWSYTGSGKIGQGAVSTGVSGITVPDHDALDPCAAFSYEGWINLPNITGNYVFVVKNPDSKTFLFASIYGFCGSGVPIGGYSDISSPVACSTTALTPGFKHLALTYDSTLGSANVKLYLNGVQVASANGTDLLNATTGTLQFCQSGFGEICPSGTVIDELRIYNYARSASEILSSVTAPPVFTIKLDVTSIKIGPSVSLKVGVP